MFSSAMLRAMKRLIPHFSVILVITAVVVFLVGLRWESSHDAKFKHGHNKRVHERPALLRGRIQRSCRACGRYGRTGRKFHERFVTIRSIQAHTSADRG